MNSPKESWESDTFPSLSSSCSVPNMDDILEHTEIHAIGGGNAF